MTKTKTVASAGALMMAALSACSSDDAAISAPPKTDAQWSAEVAQAMHDSILEDIRTLVRASEDLQAAAPAPVGRGWDRASDGAAIRSMQDAWIRARGAYEHVEGALAPIFPEIDASIDARYDGFLEGLGAGGDPDLFDGAGVTGLHAVERILWADVVPEAVTAFERTLPGYEPPAIPATQEEAARFKDKLCAKMLEDARTLESQWTPAKIGVANAYRGLVGLMNEQRSKVSQAAEGSEESRYSQQTMRDLRYNLEGTAKIYALFKPWIAAKQGADTDKAIVAGFEQLGVLYNGVPGDAIPRPPATWRAEAPSSPDLATPFGALYTAVQRAADPGAEDSIVSSMNTVADLLGFPRGE